ncbi:MAG: hypothetical protein ACYC35_26705 [Pirellulales bacterium]
MRPSIVKPRRPIQVLSRDERKEFAQYEAVIERGRQTFLEVGQALAAIRDGRLYRQNFDTFEAYCQDRWDFKRDYANKLIRAAKTVSSLDTKVSIVPTTETQARELSRLPEEQRAGAWEETVERVGGQPTAKDIKETVDLWDADNQPYVEPDDESQDDEDDNAVDDDQHEDGGADQDEQQQDDHQDDGREVQQHDFLGNIVPAHAAAMFNRDTYDHAAGCLNATKAAIKTLAAGPSGKLLQRQMLFDRLNDVAALLKESLAYALCPKCGGKGCWDCFDTGIVDEDRYHRYTRGIKALAEFEGRATA